MRVCVCVCVCVCVARLALVCAVPIALQLLEPAHLQRTPPQQLQKELTTAWAALDPHTQVRKHGRLGGFSLLFVTRGCAAAVPRCRVFRMGGAGARMLGSLPSCECEWCTEQLALRGMAPQIVSECL